MDISLIDKNFKPEGVTHAEESIFINADALGVYGVFREGDKYRRMPEAVARSVSEGVYILHTNTAGGRVRFVTDSDYITICAKMDSIGRMSHFAYTGSAGFDMYVDGRYHSSFVPPHYMTDGYSATKELGGRACREILINFPLYSNVNELYIGVRADSLIGKASPYRCDKPVVFYGSSITQGGCASRPGTSYQSILSRRLSFDFINLGFSGNARAEDEMLDYISGLDMCAFVLDYDHNSPSTEHLALTHPRAYKRIREKNPTLPIVIMQRPKHYLNDEEKERCRIVESTYRNAVLSGDERVRLVDHLALTKLCGDEGTVDGCHPTDLGFAAMADGLTDALGELLDKYI